MPRPRSLILVTVDCLRADHVGFMGYSRPTTPFLDALAADSIVFDDAVVTGTPTYYSFPGIMASRYPLALGRDVIGIAPEEPTIASVLRQSGFATAAFLAGNPYLTRQLGYAEGFDSFCDFLDPGEKSELPKNHEEKPTTRNQLNRFVRNASEKLGMRSLYDRLYFHYGQKVAGRSPKSLDQGRRFPSADRIVDKAIEWLAQLDGKDFFLWLHLMDLHAPYYPVKAALEMMGDGAITSQRAHFLNSYWNRRTGAARMRRYRKEIMALYDSGIRWVDQQLSRLVAVLRDLGLWEGCLFALTGDHGEEFLEHGGQLHGPPKVTEELVHVPLLLHLDRMPAQRIEAPFSLLHLAPTLLDCLQVPLPDAFQGESCWPHIQSKQAWGGDAIIECVRGCADPLRKAARQNRRILAVRQARHKLILNFDAEPDQFFDLHADRAELHPLPEDNNQVIRRRLLERAHEHIVKSSRERDLANRAALLLRNIFVERPESLRA